MFINLTNHPSEKWSEEQLEAARRYGEIVDMTFPIIEPTFTKEDVLRFVKVYTEMIKGIREKQTIVHVMGEMTFTCNLVNALKDLGITSLASTTERNTIMTPDGKKISEFKFVQFREY
ncbi:MAG: CRISPR-associated protein [Prevotella sp.]|nr:CRISPR-associated protein [Prevotella sp.]